MADYDYDKYEESYETTAEEEVEDLESGGVVTSSADAVLEEDEEVVEPESTRVTEKPESDTVEFTVVKSFTWHGQEFEIGDHELEQDDYDAMMYDINLRQDRVRLVL